MVAEVSKILNDLDTFLVPRRCFGCNAHLYRGEPLLCAFCRNELPLTDYNFSHENPVDRLFFGRCEVEKSSALFYYTPSGIVRKLIHQLKYGGRQDIGAHFGSWFGECLRNDTGLGTVDWVLPVPLHPRKRRSRGYNQCTLLAQHIASCLGARFSGDLLKRKVHSRTQTGRNRQERWEGIRDAFVLEDAARLQGCRILLVDDVITTGATLEACCAAFRPLAGKTLYIAALAAVP